MSLENAHPEQAGIDVVSSAPTTSQVNVFATILRFLHLVAPFRPSSSARFD